MDFYVFLYLQLDKQKEKGGEGGNDRNCQSIAIKLSKAGEHWLS